MASGHVSRIERPNTWLHRPMLQNVKKALANSEPSTHGTFRNAGREIQRLCCVDPLSRQPRTDIGSSGLSEADGSAKSFARYASSRTSEAKLS